MKIENFLISETNKNNIIWNHIDENITFLKKILNTVKKKIQVPEIEKIDINDSYFFTVKNITYVFITTFPIDMVFINKFSLFKIKENCFYVLKTKNKSLKDLFDEIENQQIMKLKKDMNYPVV